MDTIVLNTETVDHSKVETVKRLKKDKRIIWLTFLLLGWSYGSLGKIGWQMTWYVLLGFTGYNLWTTFESSTFDVYSGMAIMGALVFVGWFIARLFTLNRCIIKFNRDLADFYYLTPEERAEVGID